MRKEFEVHMLNTDGKDKAMKIAENFEELLNWLESVVADPRCISIVRTKMEEACFFAKKGMAIQKENQF